jgi:hypothetical protein
VNVHAHLRIKMLNKRAVSVRRFWCMPRVEDIFSHCRNERLGENNNGNDVVAKLCHIRKCNCREHNFPTLKHS